MRSIAAALTLYCLIGPAPWNAYRMVHDHDGQAIVARAAAVPPALTQTGALRLDEAWRLTSPNSRFGGLSALALTGDRRFLAMSDQGLAVRFRLPHGGGRVADVRLAPIGGLRSNAHKAASDVESLVYDPGRRQFWIAFEGTAQVWRTNDRTRAVEARHQIAAMKGWPSNRGPEAMARLADGRFVILSESADEDPRGTEALIFPTDPAETGPAPVRFFYDDRGMGQLTDAATLPDGRLLLLHRRLLLGCYLVGQDAYVSTIAIADLSAVRADDVVRAIPVVTIGAPSLSDNFEGMAIGRESGRWVLWLVSDDNFNAWQATYLLKFIVDPARLPVPPRA
jgi:hypothetical protein